MKKQNLLLVVGIVLTTTIGYSQSNNLKIGGQDLDNGDYVGSNNNKNLVIKTNGQTNTIFKKEGGIDVKKLASFDSVSISKYMRVDSIHARSIRVGNNSLYLGSSPLPGGLSPISDFMQSDNGAIMFGKYSGAGPYNPSLFSQFRMGIGFINPQFNVHVHDAQIGPNDVKQSFSNQATGSSSSDGFQIGILSNQSAILRQQELNQPVNIVTQGGFVGANNANNSFFAPQSLMHISDGAAATNYQVTNNATGVTATDGLKLGISNLGAAILNQQENFPMTFLTGNAVGASTERMRIMNATGRVGINNTNPLNRFVVTSAAADFGGGNALTPGGSSGIRTTNMTSATPTLAGNGKVVTVNANGDFYLAPDGGGTAGPATVTAKNGLNVTVGPPDVELGGLLLHNTDIDMGNNYQMAWFNKGRHIFQDANSTVIPPGIYVPKIYVESNTYATSLELLTNLPSNINGTTYGQVSRNQTKNGAANYGGFYEADGDQDAYGLSANSISSGLNANVYGAQCIANKGVLNIGGDFYANGDPLLTNKAFGVIGTAVNGISECNGVFGTALGNALLKKGVYGIVNSTLPSGSSFGIFGDASGGNSLSQPAFSRVYGVYGQSEYAVDNYGVYGTVLNSGVNGYAVYGDASNTNGFTGAVYAGYFNGNVNVNGTVTAFAYIPSDQNLKTNINPILNSKTIISQLQPKHFYYDTTKYFLNGVNKKNYGLIAQDVQNVLPELVSTYIIPDKKDSTGNVIANGGTFKTLNNNAFIGILLANAKEQNNRIDSLITALNSNSRLINPNQGPTNPATNVTTLNKQNVTLSNADMLVLDQNQPNPFSESTVIKYNVPEKYGYAQLIFTTIEGRILKTIDIAKKGAGEITVYANDLSNGIYTYTLVVDGKTVDSKKMVKQN